MVLRDTAAATIKLCRFDGMGLERDPKPLADRAKNSSEIVHAWIALFREHPVETLARPVRVGSQVFEADRGIDQVPKDQARDIGLAIQESGRSFVQPA
jgi:hypothetical protein